MMQNIYTLLFAIGILVSSTVHAELKFPTPKIASTEKTVYANPKSISEKKAAGKFIFTQYTKDYNEQFRKDNQFDKDVISPEMLTDLLAKIDELKETDLDQPITFHITNVKTGFDMIAQQIYDQQSSLINPNGGPNNASAENSLIASRFRGLEIFFAIIVVVLASLLYKKTYKVFNKNNSGMSIIEVIVAIGLLSIVGVGVSSLIGNMMTNNNYATMGNSALNLKAELTAILSDERAWKNTYTDAATNPDATANLGCIRAGTDCAALIGVESPFIPKLNSNTLFRGGYTAAATQGFDVNGVMCNAYPSNTCLMRYTFTWQPICPASGVCIKPSVRIRLIFTFNAAATSTKLSPQRYGNDNIIVGSDTSSYTESSCILIGGSWNPTTQVCTPAPLPSGTTVNVSCSSSSYNTTCTPYWVPPVTAPGCCTTGSGSGSTTTTTCTCTVVVTAGYWGTSCATGANGTCACPASCPTNTGTAFTPAVPVSPAPYSVGVTCLCP